MELRQIPHREDRHQRDADPNREGNACEALDVIEREEAGVWMYFTVKPGPITLLSIASTGKGFHFVARTVPLLLLLIRAGLITRTFT